MSFSFLEKTNHVKYKAPKNETKSSTFDNKDLFKKIQDGIMKILLHVKFPDGKIRKQYIPPPINSSFPINPQYFTPIPRWDLVKGFTSTPAKA